MCLSYENQPPPQFLAVDHSQNHNICTCPLVSFCGFDFFILHRQLRSCLQNVFPKGVNLKTKPRKFPRGTQQSVWFHLDDISIWLF